MGRATVSVTATDPDGLSAVQRFRVTIYLQPGRTPPTPSGLRVEKAGRNFIVWRWDPVAVATGYDVQFSRDARFAAPLDPVVAVDGTFHRATGLPEGVKAYLRVRAVVRTAGARVESGWSTPVAGMTVGATNTLSTPANLRVTDAGANSIEWTWDDVPGTDGYEMQLRRDGNFREADRVSTAPFTTTIVTRLSNNTEYHIRVRAVADAGATRQRSDWSESVSGWTTPESRFDRQIWNEIAFDAYECPDAGLCQDGSDNPALHDRVLSVLPTTSPSFHIRTANDRGEPRMPSATARGIRGVITRAVEALTGQAYDGDITIGEEDVQEDGWITIEFVPDEDNPGFWDATVCGKARIGSIRGRIRLRSDLNGQFACSLDSVFRHELGHAMGFFHVRGNQDLMSASVNAIENFTPREEFHAQLAYELGRDTPYTRGPLTMTSAERTEAPTGFMEPAPIAICYGRPGAASSTH